MTTGYVYHKQLVGLDQLGTLISKYSNSESYYFLRYSHAVSGICQILPSDRGEIQGQMFNSICEIRWKKYKSGYEVLILSKQDFKSQDESSLESFEKLPCNWEIHERDAYLHDQKETKFPKGFIFKDKDNKPVDPNTIPIKQRYFQDSATATIHFVALTVNSK